MPRVTSILAAALLMAVSSCCHQKVPQSDGLLEIEVEQIAQQPNRYLTRTLQTVGWLKNSGSNYFADLKLVLAGDKGGQIEVTAWAPLEVPPPRPGSQRANRPKVMSDFLGKRMRLTGRLEEQSGRMIFRVEKAEVVSPGEGDDAR